MTPNLPGAQISSQLGSRLLGYFSCMTLVQRIYASRRSPALRDEDVERILLASRENNAAAGITGLLVCSGSRFLQTLEGPEPVVRALFERIAADPRHEDVLQLSVEPVSRRGFGLWTMGYAQVTDRQLDVAVNSHDLMSAATLLGDVTDDAARAVLLQLVRGTVARPLDARAAPRSARTHGDATQSDRHRGPRALKPVPAPGRSRRVRPRSAPSST